jgi:hypothetical protein
MVNFFSKGQNSAVQRLVSAFLFSSLKAPRPASLSGVIVIHESVCMKKEKFISQLKVSNECSSRKVGVYQKSGTE